MSAQVQKRPGTVVRLFANLKGQRLRLGVVAVSIVIYVALSIWNPMYSAIVIDHLWQSVRAAWQSGAAFHLTNALRRELVQLTVQYVGTWLFGGTVAENIAYGRPDATRSEIVAAAKAAKVDYFIRTMPQGYDTVLDNDAANLSAGQRQLLTIARVFLCDPPILILDEATSSVDTRTEVEIGKAMKKLMDGRTSFVIAHRLSTIRDADLILYMEHGNIIEQGDHQTLLAKGGAYAALYYSQFE